jgi:hypothetical protein
MNFRYRSCDKCIDTVLPLFDLVALTPNQWAMDKNISDIELGCNTLNIVPAGVGATERVVLGGLALISVVHPWGHTTPHGYARPPTIPPNSSSPVRQWVQYPLSEEPIRQINLASHTSGYNLQIECLQRRLAPVNARLPRGEGARSSWIGFPVHLERIVQPTRRSVYIVNRVFIIILPVRW